MRGGTKLVLLISLAATSCASPTPETRIRPAGAAPVSGTVADGEAQLALGNVALAMENFRKALREQPSDIRAMSGLALSYEDMGRTDLARKWLETALAVAPDNPELLHQLADVLDLQGSHDQAVAVRAEAAVDARLIARATNAALAQHNAPAPSMKPASSVTVVLPPPNPAVQPSPNVLVTEISAAPAAVPPVGNGPRLERLSLGEVALITTRQPIWRGAPQALALRYVPLQPAARLLNAARIQGLAARTRGRLLGRGWKRIEIGDAPVVRSRTLVLYPPAERARAQRLITELGVGSAQPSFAAQITVLLGRDITRSGARRRT